MKVVWQSLKMKLLSKILIRKLGGNIKLFVDLRKCRILLLKPSYILLTWSILRTLNLCLSISVMLRAGLTSVKWSENCILVLIEMKMDFWSWNRCSCHFFKKGVSSLLQQVRCQFSMAVNLWSEQSIKCFNNFCFITLIIRGYRSKAHKMLIKRIYGDRLWQFAWKYSKCNIAT